MHYCLCVEELTDASCLCAHTREPPSQRSAHRRGQNTWVLAREPAVDKVKCLHSRNVLNLRQSLFQPLLHFCVDELGLFGHQPMARVDPHHLWSCIQASHECQCYRCRFVRNKRYRHYCMATIHVAVK